ncbi:MAG: cbb3-type cytochrome c oxidase subunit II [Gemmatimonadales bacterium]
MTRTWLLLLGALATVGFAVIVLIVLPQVVLVDVPVPPELTPRETVATLAQDSLIRRGRHVYLQNGCVYCHSQQVRDPAFTTDVERGWGSRASVPADYVLDAPHVLGTMRTGPDLFDVGRRLPDANWHLIHLYDPRALVEWSIMPAFPFLFDEREPGDVAAGERVVVIPGARAPTDRAVVASADALALVAYLLSLRHDYPVAAVDSAGARTVNTMP